MVFKKLTKKTKTKRKSKFVKKNNYQIKRIVRALEQPRHKTSLQTANMYHNDIVGINLLGNIPQGDTDFSRESDTIRVDGIKLRFNLTTYGSQIPTSPSLYRLLLVYTRDEFGGGSDTWTSSGLLPSEIFYQSSGGATHAVLQCINPKKLNVLWDKTFNLIHPTVDSSGDVYQVSNKIVTKFIRIGKTFKYWTNSNYGKWGNYYLVAMAFHEGGTDGSSQVGKVTVDYDLVFRNSQ